MTSTVLKKRFQNQLTKVSDYKQAVQLVVGQLASKTDHGFPGIEENAKPVNTGKKLIWVPRTSTQWGKGLAPLLTGHLCRTHKSTTETHFKEASFYKLILFSLWFGKSGAEP